MKPHVVAFIFARGGSKGLIHKNLRQLAGKPLIGHAITAALASRWAERVVVSTDSTEIAEAARSWGAEVPFLRPLELASDDSPEWLSWQHAIRTMSDPNGRKIDVFVSVPPTAPLRTTSDIDGCVDTLLASDADIVLSVAEAERSPYFNMVELDNNGYARLVKSSPGSITRRQVAPKVFSVSTVAYAARPAFVLKANSIFEGRVRTWQVPRERAVDIDTELDLAFAEFLTRRSISMQ